MTMQILSRGHDDEGKPFGMREVLIGGTRCLDNGRVVIGLALAINPPPPTPTQHGELLQAALLDKRTTTPASPLARVFGKLWSLA